MGEAFITRRGGAGIKVKAYEPFTKRYVNSSSSPNGRAYYQYTGCEFAGRTFLLFAANATTSSLGTAYNHFAIIENGVITEEYDSWAIYNLEDPGEILIRVSIDGTTLTIEGNGVHAESPLLIEI